MEDTCVCDLAQAILAAYDAYLEEGTKAGFPGPDIAHTGAVANLSRPAGMRKISATAKNQALQTLMDAVRHRLADVLLPRMDSPPPVNGRALELPFYLRDAV